MPLTPKKVYAILKHQISDMESQLNHPVRYKGTVSTADLLPLNPAVGDMYNIESKSIYGEAGMNVAWNGVTWDTMGAPIDMSLYFTKEEADTTIQNMVNEYLENNPIKPGATTEQAQQIEQNKTDIALLKEDKADKTALVKTDRKLDALWKLNQGISYEFQTDEAEAYQKTVPSGAKMANVKSIGGKTIVWNQFAIMTEEKDENGLVVTVDRNTSKFTVNGKSTGDVFIGSRINNKSVIGHKILFRLGTSIPGTTTYATIELPNTTYIKGIGGIRGAIYDVVNNDKEFHLWYIYVNETDVVFDNVTFTPQLFDLTKMFGEGNEPSTVEEFEAMFPADYYPYNAGELMSALVNEVIYLDAKNQETSYPIPQAILNLPGYGWSAGTAYNYVDLENKQYIQRVASVDLGNLKWYEGATNVTDYIKMYTEGLIGIVKNVKTADTIGDILSDKYVSTTANNTYTLHLGISVEIDGTISVYDPQYNVSGTSEAFTLSLQGSILYYELAEPIITDISDIISDTFQEPIEVEAGGTLTFRNIHGDDYRIPVPSSEEYVISLAEVAK